MNDSRAFRWAATALYLYAFTFVLLSIDLLARVWSWRDRFPQFTDVLVIGFFEASRSGVVLAAIAIGLALSWRHSHDSAMRALAVAIGFATIAFVKVAAFPLFAGAAQQQTTAWLLAHDVPRTLLVIVFGRPAWAAWLALAALMLFAARYPQPVTVEAIAESGRHDRAGMLRGNPLAGIDIGALFRKLAAAMLERGLLTPPRLTLGALGLAVLHTVFHGPAAHAIGALIMALGLGVAISLARAGRQHAAEREQRFLDWLMAGTLGAAVMFALSAGAHLASGGTSPIGIVLLALAPVPALVGLAGGLLQPDGLEPARLLSRFR